MKNFKTSGEFYRSLCKSIKSGKDTYVFGCSANDKSDYQLEEDEKSNDYYVTDKFDLNELQLELFGEFGINNPNIIISLDYIYCEEDDFILKRLFIFKSV